MHLPPGRQPTPPHALLIAMQCSLPPIFPDFTRTLPHMSSTLVLHHPRQAQKVVREAAPALLSQRQAGAGRRKALAARARRQCCRQGRRRRVVAGRRRGGNGQRHDSRPHGGRSGWHRGRPSGRRRARLQWRRGRQVLTASQREGAARRQGAAWRWLRVQGDRRGGEA